MTTDTTTTATSTTTTATSTTTSPATDFVFFEGAASVNAVRPRITVRRGGLLVLTAAAVAMLGEKVDTVQLAFNRETGAVAIRAASPGAAGAYRLRHQMKGSGRQITGKRFFEHFGLDVSTGRAFEATSFGDGLIGFQLEPMGGARTVNDDDRGASEA